MKKGEVKYSGMALISFLLVILGFVWATITLANVFSSFTFFSSWSLFVLAIAFGIFGVIQIKKNGKLRGKVLSWLGIILGLLGTFATYFTRPIY